jgi:hypothetical protein
MATYSLDVLLSWRGRTVYDREGEKLGRLDDLYLDGATDTPTHAGVRTGLLGRHLSIVPLAGAEERDGDIHLPYDAELVRSARASTPTPRWTRMRSTRSRSTTAATTTACTAPRSPGPCCAPRRSSASGAVRCARRAGPPAQGARHRARRDHGPRRREVVQLETDAPPVGRIEHVEELGEQPVPARPEPRLEEPLDESFGEHRSPGDPIEGGRPLEHDRPLEDDRPEGPPVR